MKILLFANTDWYLYNFRLPLARALQERGHQVLLVTPPGEYVDRLQAAGFEWRAFRFSRSGINPLQEAWAVLRLTRLYLREKPDLVHQFTPKCVLYGSLAARLAGIRHVVNAVTGLGYVFAESRGLRGLLQWLVIHLYRIALRPTWVIFQNPDDQQAFLEKGLVDRDQISLIRSSGVDLQRFKPQPEPKGTPLVVLAARLLWDKGVGDFVQAAQILKEQGILARFALVGENDPGNPASVPAEQIHDWVRKILIEWWGWREDMVEVYHQAHVICLPSSYREGVPKTLIEAAACGRPIVATDVPGCREVIIQGENGFLVPVRDPSALSQALAQLLASPELRQRMGARGRKLVEQEFSQGRVINETLQVYQTMYSCDF